MDRSIGIVLLLLSLSQIMSTEKIFSHFPGSSEEPQQAFDVAPYWASVHRLTTSVCLFLRVFLRNFMVFFYTFIGSFQRHFLVRGMLRIVTEKMHVPKCEPFQRILSPSNRFGTKDLIPPISDGWRSNEPRESI